MNAGNTHYTFSIIQRKNTKPQLRYQNETSKANRILDLMSLTVEEFEQLVSPFEMAFVRHMRT